MAAKVRIYDIAKELSVSPREVLDMLNSIGVANKVASSSVEPMAAQSLRQLVANRTGSAVETPGAAPNARPMANPSAPASAPVNQVAAPANNGANGASNGVAASNGAAPQSDGRTATIEARGNDGRSSDGRTSDGRPAPRGDGRTSDGRPSAAPRGDGRADNRGNDGRTAPRSEAPRGDNRGDGRSAPSAPRGDGRGNDGRAPLMARGDGRVPVAPSGRGPAAVPTGRSAPAPQDNSGDNRGPRTGGYQGNRPGGPGAGGGNRGPGGPRTGGAPGGGPSRGPRGGGGRAQGGRGPAQPAAGAAGAPKPQNLENSPFAVGGRDRRNAKRGKYRGRKANRGMERFEEEVVEAPLTDADMTIVVTGEITVGDLAKKMRKPVNEVIKSLFAMGVMRAANAPLEMDVASNLAAKFGFSVERKEARSEVNVSEEENPDELIDVPPVVVVMGHVDHGKTSLLDRIRGGKVQAGEAGGITQRIGAYETEHNGQRLVFLDTPGHEAFTRMRARGAHVTDIAILVVAANDGVMPQTREAIDHARAAKLPIIVALNKTDLPDADPDRIYGQLAEAGLVPESYGGDTVVVPVSAKTGAGVSDLLDIVLLVTEIQELKANPEGLASGTVIEARQDANLGPVATVLLHRGTLEVGDDIAIGEVYGRVRQMLDYNGKPLEEAGPKTPVFITGLNGVPGASDVLRAYETPQDAREAAEEFEAQAREGRSAATMRSLADLYDKIKSGDVKDLNLIVKADGQGSVEAIASSLEKLAHREVRVKFISRSVGQVTESDVDLASASEAFIIAFAVGVAPGARALAERENVEIRSYEVIYDAIDDVKAALEGLLKPMYEEVYMGEAEVRQLFKSTKAGGIAGCMVLEGKFVKGGILRVFRNQKQLFEGKVDSLRHFKEEVKEMAAGQECGISTNGFNNFEEGDRLRCFTMRQLKRTLDD